MEILTDSLEAYISGFSLNSAVILIMTIFMFAGAFDLLRGNKLGLGENFEEGFKILGGFFMPVVGIYALIPVFCQLFGNVITTCFALIGCDPSLFAGMFIANDMGAYPLALSLANSGSMAAFTGLVIGSIMGVNIVWSIPVAMQAARGEDSRFMAQGLLLGLVTVPVGSLTGGLLMMLFGYEISILQVIVNTIPIAVLSMLIIVCVVLSEAKTIRAFSAFGRGINYICIVSVAIAVFQYLTGIRLPLLHLMVDPDADGTIPIIDAGTVLIGVGFILIGAFPMVKFITEKFQQPLSRLGKNFDLDENSVAGIIASMANIMLMLVMFKDMTPKGKVAAAAFSISGAYALGDHMGFTASIDKNMVVPVFFAKLIAGGTAVLIVLLLWKRIAPPEDES